MKIFILIHTNPFVESSASANRWLTLIEGLAKLRAELHLFIYGGYKSFAEKEEWGKEGSRQQIEYEYINQEVNEGYWKSRYNNYIGHYFTANKTRKKLLKLLSSQKGVVWTDSSTFGFQMATSLKKKQVKDLKLFLELSEFLDIYKYNKGNFLQRWKAAKRQKFFEKKAFYAYDGLALMTRTLFKHYTNFRPPIPKLLHLPMTVDLERFNENIKPLTDFKKPYIAFVGVMNDAKDGVSILIKAFAKITTEFPELNLYLVGGWNYDTPIHKQLIEDFNLKDKVFWKGAFDRDKIPAIINNATILTLPRPDSKQAQGGFPTKLGEYLATGNPVCATTVGELPDYLVDGESVCFAVPGSVESFADALRRALSNKEEAKQIGLNGRKVAERHFNKDAQAKTLYDFLQELSES
jgi:glycosyltransferase involved in cell wall biosynthesis